NVKGHLLFISILDEYHLRKHPTTGQIVCNFHHNSAVPLPQKSNAELATSSKIGLSEVNDDKVGARLLRATGTSPERSTGRSKVRLASAIHCGLHFSGKFCSLAKKGAFSLLRVF
ncbi:hypothetical protein M513_01089, partial [Trichuris suis]